MVSGLKVLLGLQTHAHKLITFKVKIGGLTVLGAMRSYVLISQTLEQYAVL